MRPLPRFYGRHSGKPAGPVIAAIDLGTTSCRLLVACAETAGFRIIDSFSRVVRLGEGVQASNTLQPQAIARTFEALKICQGKIKKNRVDKLRAVTTEACRRAHNSHILLDRVQAELGISLEIISTVEEARLALAGCAGILDRKIPYAVAFDIGGGSTEIIWLKICNSDEKQDNGLVTVEVIDCESIPFGVVTLSELYGNHFIDHGIYEDFRLKIARKVRDFSEKNNIYKYMNDGLVQMAGTSGTITTIGAIYLNLQKYDRRHIDGLFLSLDDIHKVSSQLSAMSHLERARHPCIGVSRADLMIMGTAILEGICDGWPLPRLRIADRGIREGILMELLKEFNL
jgi:exopolyphosphatase/guanosine-5'-triphosphate,3'-diphosphate pyrophosphatase